MHLHLKCDFLPSEDASKWWALAFGACLQIPQCVTHTKVLSQQFGWGEWKMAAAPPRVRSLFAQPGFFKISYHTYACVKNRKGAFSNWKKRGQLFAARYRSKKLPLSRARRSFAHPPDETRFALLHASFTLARCKKKTVLHKRGEFLEQTLLAQFQRRRTRCLSFVFFVNYETKSFLSAHKTSVLRKLYENNFLVTFFTLSQRELIFNSFSF